MEKVNPTQLELFELSEPAASTGKDFAANSHLHGPLVRRYQKVIINIVAVIFISLASYSLGVEKGKKTALVTAVELSAPHVNTQINLNAITPADSSGARASSVKESGNRVKVNARVDTQANTEENKEKDKEKTRINNFTIQVASISQNKNVSKELAQLKNKGYSAFSMPKGKYTVICVGEFSVKEDAHNAFLKLKSSYPDCQLRRL